MSPAAAQDAQSIKTNQAGVAVYLNGESQGLTNDVGILRIYAPPGEYTIRLEKDGFAPVSSSITIRAVYDEYSFTLVEESQIIRTSPGGVDVFVGDVRIGTTDSDGMLASEIAAGEHAFRLEKAGYATLSDTRTVTGSTREILFSLDPSGSWLSRTLKNIKPVEWLLIAMGGLCLVLGTLLGAVLIRQRSPRARRVGLIPSSFDRYDVVRQLGRGGMATVYLARDRTLGDEVALKVMDNSLLNDPDLVRKFVKEGEALQKISASSPRAPVVRALRYGREHNAENGRPYVALEYLEGTTLLNLIRQNGPIPVRHVLVVARQVAEGLAAAHAHGIWHRDISPDNVFMTGEDYHGPTVKLIDFGEAKHEFTQIHTLDGSIAGKPAYMSPEQCRGEAVDGRTDLYSVGVLMYTLLTGHPPFSDQNPLIVMKLHENAAPPPLPTNIPQPVAALVYRLLNKNPNDRPSSASELAVEIYALERMN